MVRVIQYTPEHQQGVVDVVLSIQQREFNLPITLEAQPDLTDIAGFYQSGRGNFWVALEDARVIGSIGLRDIGDHQGALRKMFVAAEYRGATQGVAQLLLDYLLAWAQIQEFTDVYLGTTEQFRAAHRFYAKNHFNAIERTSLPPSFPVMAVDTRFFLRSL